MAKSTTVIRFRMEWDPEDRAAFERDAERIILKYGDQPHTRQRRDEELERAAQLFVSLGSFVQVPADG
jgi:hypothetical protein